MSENICCQDLIKFASHVAAQIYLEMYLCLVVSCLSLQHLLAHPLWKHFSVILFFCLSPLQFAWPHHLLTQEGGAPNHQLVSALVEGSSQLLCCLSVFTVCPSPLVINVSVSVYPCIALLAGAPVICMSGSYLTTTVLLSSLSVCSSESPLLLFVVLLFWLRLIFFHLLVSASEDGHLWQLPECLKHNTHGHTKVQAGPVFMESCKRKKKKKMI